MKHRRAYELTAACVAWFALALQFVLLVFDPAPPPAVVAAVNYFSYFTIETNILVALAFTAGVFQREDAFFNRAGVRAAIAAYIAIVAIVYHFILDALWRPTGLSHLANILLHYVTPAAYWAGWILFAPKKGLAYPKALGWLIYPALFGLWSLIRGAATGFYPYPFLNAGAEGYPRVFVNIALLVGVFGLAGCAVIALARRLSRKGA